MRNAWNAIADVHFRLNNMKTQLLRSLDRAAAHASMLEHVCTSSSQFWRLIRSPIEPL